MPEFAVSLGDLTGRPHPETLIVMLNKAPKRGSVVTLTDGTSAKVRDVRMIGGEKVIIANRIGEGTIK